VVPRFSDTPGSVRWTGAGTPGTHNHEVFGDLLGRSPAQIAELQERGVL
jgi:formyl-CoA transferase